MRTLLPLLTLAALSLACGRLASDPPEGPPAAEGEGEGEQPGEGEGEGEVEPLPPQPPGPSIPDDGFAESQDARVVWKRGPVLARDLARALDVPRDQLCKELETRDCFTDVHLAPLGGHDPIDLAQYEGLAAPSRLTPIALERVALAACQKRAELDAGLIESGQAGVVFTFPLTFEQVTREDTDALADSLYARLFARRPTVDERDTLGSLVEEGVSKRDAGLMSCFALVSSTENLFF